MATGATAMARGRLRLIPLFCYSRGYGYGGYGYGRNYGYRSYGYGKREAEADPALLYAGPYNYGYAGALTAYTGYPYAAYGAYPYAAYGAYPYAYGYFGGLQAHPNGAVTPIDEPAVQAAKADHFAAKAAAYAAAPIAAPIAVAAPAATIALAKREAEPAYYGGYRSYGYGRRYGGYGYRSYGYGY